MKDYSSKFKSLPIGYSDSLPTFPQTKARPDSRVRPQSLIYLSLKKQFTRIFITYGKYCWGFYGTRILEQLKL